MAPRPHDLLLLRHPAAFAPAGAPPHWLDLAHGALVVRREATPPGIVPVGARGLARSQRCKGYVPAAAVARCVAPETLRARPPAAGGPACLAALHALAPRLDALDVAWGPTGGVGYHLATGLPVLRADSDLDLVVRLPARPAAALVDALADAVADALADAVATLAPCQPCRVDVQLDTGTGACALAEYARGGRVLLKTGHGPLLVADPWDAGLPA